MIFGHYFHGAMTILSRWVLHQILMLFHVYVCSNNKKRKNAKERAAFVGESLCNEVGSLMKHSNF